MVFANVLQKNLQIIDNYFWLLFTAEQIKLALIS